MEQERSGEGGGEEKKPSSSEANPSPRRPSSRRRRSRRPNSAKAAGESAKPAGEKAESGEGGGEQKSGSGRRKRWRRGRRGGRGPKDRAPKNGNGGERTPLPPAGDLPESPDLEGALVLVDSHAHLDDAAFDRDRRGIYERAVKSGVGFILTVGSDVNSSRKSVDIAKTFPGVHAAVGVHPHEVKSVGKKTIASLTSLAENPKVVAIGEIGLDYYRNQAPHKLQKHWFREQIRLAVKLQKPVIVHCRDAGEDVFNILEEERVWRAGGVVHCFTGDAELARKFLGLDLYLGAGGAITFENQAELREVFAEVPMERILIETDSPYLTPPPNRGKRNEPAYVVRVAEKLAEIKGLSLEDVVRATSVNVRRLFGMGSGSQPGTIAYPILGKLYLNITNRCSNVCFFCGLLSDRVYKGFDLTLEEEPDADAILEAVDGANGELADYEEVVFSGFGEPTLRLDVLKEVAGTLKQRGAKRIRLVTNGLGSRTNERNILPELRGLIDAVSVSMQAESPESYDKICKTKEIENPYPSVKEFIKEAKSLFEDVEVTAVEMRGLIDIEACEKVVTEELGVPFRKRMYSLAD